MSTPISPKHQSQYIGPQETTSVAPGIGPQESASGAPCSRNEFRALLPQASFCSADPIVALQMLSVLVTKQKREADEVSAEGYAKAEDAADAQRIGLLHEKAESEFKAAILSGGGKVLSGMGTAFGGVKGKGIGDAAQGSADMLSAGWKRDAGVTESAIAQAESMGKVAKRAFEKLNKEIDAAKQHEGKAMQILQEMKQAQVAAEKAILSR
jgi:hypothetical protein